jgi:AsmA protein
MKILKWTAVGIAGLIVVVIAALLIIPHFIDAKQYRALLERKVAEATGRKMSVGEDVRLSLFPWAGVSFNDLRLENPEGFVEKDFLTVKSFDVRVKLMPLLSREVLIDRLVVKEPRVFLVTRADGRVSWEFGGKPDKDAQAAPGAAGAGLPIQALLVEELSVSDGKLTLIDHKTEARTELSALNLMLKDVSFDRPVTLALSATLNGKPIAVEGRVGPVGKNLGQGAVPVELTAELFKQLNVRLKGGLENVLAAPRARLAVEVAEFSPRRLLAELGQAAPATADPGVLERLAFTGTLEADPGAATLAGGLITLDDSRITLGLTAKEFSKPNLAFDLTLDRIDLDRYLPPKAKASPSAGQAGQASQPAETPPAGGTKSKTEYGPLRKLVLKGSVAVGTLKVSNATIEDIKLAIAARGGVLNLDPIAMKLYQGSAGGKATVDVTGDVPATDLRLAVSGVQVNPLLKDVAGKDFLEGRTRAEVALTMRGDTPERIKQTLSGKGDLTFTDGAIVGVDLAGMVRNVKAALGGETASGPRPRTDFAELAVPFTLDNGVFKTPESALKSPLVRLQAAGEANLVRETLDFRVEPKVVGTLKGQGDAKERSGLMVPVLVSGTFADPKFRPDLESLAKGSLKEALAPAKEAAKEAAGPLKEKAGGLIKGLFPGK